MGLTLNSLLLAIGSNKAKSIDLSFIEVDEVNKRIGLGTTPTEHLHLRKDQDDDTTILVENRSTGVSATTDVRLSESSTKVLLTRYVNSGAAGGFLTTIPNSGVLVTGLDSSGGLLIGTQGILAPVRFFAGGVALGDEKMRILANGRIGIGPGFTAPTVLLHLKQDQDGQTAIQIENADTGVNALTDLFLVEGASKFVVLRYRNSGADGSNLAAIANSGLIETSSLAIGGLIIGTGGSAPIRFFTGGGAFADERMHITSDGKIGIGSGFITPTGDLHLKLDAASASFLIENPGTGTIAISTFTLNEDLSTKGMNFRYTNNSDTAGTWFQLANSGTIFTRSGATAGFLIGALAGDIRFFTGGTGVIADEGRMIVKANGDVGVGKGLTSPLAQFHVDQESLTGAKPVLLLDQADISKEMIEFVTTIGTNNPIEAVGAKTLTTTHFVRCTIPGGLTRYFALGTIA